VASQRKVIDLAPYREQFGDDNSEHESLCHEKPSIGSNDVNPVEKCIIVNKSLNIEEAIG